MGKQAGCISEDALSLLKECSYHGDTIRTGSKHLWQALERNAADRDKRACRKGPHLSQPGKPHSRLCIELGRSSKDGTEGEVVRIRCCGLSKLRSRMRRNTNDTIRTDDPARLSNGSIRLSDVDAVPSRFHRNLRPVIQNQDRAGSFKEGADRERVPENARWVCPLVTILQQPHAGMPQGRGCL